MTRRLTVGPLPEPQADTGAPHPARIWNYWAGGRLHTGTDRQAAQAISRLIPAISRSAAADRAFLRRAVCFLVEAGVRQFLDIGAGLPAPDNTHEVAQRAAPDARVVYLDNDPLVHSHAGAFLSGAAAGTVAFIHADANDLGPILAQAGSTLDFTRPVAVLMLGILPFIPGDAAASTLIDQVMAAVPSGSYLAISHPTEQVDGTRMRQAMADWEGVGGAPLVPRDPGRIAEFFTGLELADPGVVSCSQWRPETPPWHVPAPVSHFCGVAHKAGTAGLAGDGAAAPATGSSTDTPQLGRPGQDLPAGRPSGPGQRSAGGSR